MSRSFDREGMSDWAKYVLLAGILVTVSYYFFPMLLYFLPVPMTALHVRRGFFANVTAQTAIAAMAFFLFRETPFVASYAVFSLCLSTFMALMFQKRVAYSKILLGCVGIALAFFVGTSVLQQVLTGVGPIEGWERATEEILTTQAEWGDRFNMSPTESSNLAAAMKAMMNLLIVLMPALLLAMSFLISLFSVHMTAALLRKSGEDMSFIPKLNEFRLPSNMKIGLLTVVAAMIVFYVMKFAFFDELLTNVYFVFYVLFLVTGYLVMDNLLFERWGPVLRVLLPIGALILSLFDVFALIGVVDLFVDLRQRFRRKS